MAGVGSVFSREYYALAASRLKEGGIMAQWFHLYDMHDGIVGLVLRTFGSVYPCVEIWDSGSGDIILLGSKTPWKSSPEHYRQSFDRELVKKDLERIGIGSPEALLARQLASQRTASAIAGNGPIQTDLFPILEYEAPKAFYVGSTSRMLWKFDERTWQSDIAPAVKQKTLSRLEDASLSPVFAQFSTINEDLIAFLTWRFARAKDEGFPPFDHRALPCIFQVARSSPAAAPMEDAATASEERKKLWAAAEFLDRDSTRKEEGVKMVELLLRQYGEKSGWPVPYYAALAAKACLSSGNTEQAKTILHLALNLVPTDAELYYLLRIVEQENAKRFGSSAI